MVQNNGPKYDEELGFRDYHPLPTMKNGKKCQNNIALILNLQFVYMFNYYTVFKSTYARNKMYKSAHPPILFAASLYLPYHYNEQINTYLFALTKSKSVWINRAVRVGGKPIIYVACKE
mmetsp:Transcript_6507/g.5586  ORF Transcript_6507/g.5586 Transcript_6507/m.5586 type:complete len:119 (+) Transcript_6507:14-370(+)